MSTATITAEAVAAIKTKCKFVRDWDALKGRTIVDVKRLSDAMLFDDGSICSFKTDDDGYGCVSLRFNPDDSFALAQQFGVITREELDTVLAWERSEWQRKQTEQRLANYESLKREFGDA